MDLSKRQSLKSSSLKSGKRTFFFDVNVASNDKKYLKITESRMPEKEGDPNSRTSFVLFPEDVTEFQSKVDEAVKFING